MLSIGTRVARPEDVDFLADVFLTSMREAISDARGYWDVAKEDTQFRSQLELGASRIIRVDEKDVGFIMMRPIDPVTTELHTLCLARPYQGRGVGTRVMRDEMRAAESSSSSFELSVLKSNGRARTFYERLGFVEIGRTAHHVRMRWP